MPKDLTYHHDGLGLTDLCRVQVVDEPHPVNKAHHEYRFVRILTPDEHAAQKAAVGDDAVKDRGVGHIQFQRGPRTEPDSIPGTLDGAVLAVLIHRYECFQEGPFRCVENVFVLEHLRAALHSIKARAAERASRNVLGKNER